MPSESPSGAIQNPTKISIRTSKRSRGMSPKAPGTTSKTRNLERVRLNQQRSRARRKEYTAQLERKVAQLEHKLHQRERSIDAEDTITRLKSENQFRSELLCVLGIDAELQQRVFQAELKAEALKHLLADSMDVCGTGSPHVEVLSARDSKMRCALGASDTVPSGQSADLRSVASASSARDHTLNLRPQQHAEDNGQTGATALLERCCNFPASNPSSVSSSQMNRTVVTTETHAPNLPDTISSPETTPSTSDFTTACSVAFPILTSNNKRGYTMTDLEKRMRVGCLSGSSPDAECRIRNKVFFNVLAEIVQ